MACFTDFQDALFLCSDISPEGKREINDYLRILEDSGAGENIGIKSSVKNDLLQVPFFLYRLDMFSSC